MLAMVTAVLAMGTEHLSLKLVPRIEVRLADGVGGIGQLERPISSIGNISCVLCVCVCVCVCVCGGGWGIDSR